MKIRLLQCYEVLWIHDINAKCLSLFQTSLSQSLVSGDLPTSERQLFFAENSGTSATTTSSSGGSSANTTDVVSLASSLAHLVETMNLGDDSRGTGKNRNPPIKKLFSGGNNSDPSRNPKGTLTDYTRKGRLFRVVP